MIKTSFLTSKPFTVYSILAAILLLFNLNVMGSELGFQYCDPDTGVVVRVGADRLFEEYSCLIDGRRVALVSNHTGMLSDGRHLADALHMYNEAELKVLFGMGYNIRTNDYSLPKDDEKTFDPETGVVKYSLYDEIHKPTPEMLKEVDVIIFDIQEVGARFYEHINILGFVMEAAAENNIEIVVLDRPNPITGLKMDGFVTDNEYLYGFGAFAKVPVIHGLTMGELARLYNGEGMLRGGVRANLKVIEMKGWQRSMWFDQTGLTWEKPSPNLPSPESMLVYTGTCLFEGLNISAGRGTERPFQYIGAPWIDNEGVVKLLNGLEFAGVVFDTITFSPKKMPFHSRNPYLTGETCKGISISVTERDLFEPYKAGIALLWAIHELHNDKLKFSMDTLDRLVGTRRLVRMIKSGAHPNEIFASWDEELAIFKKVSKKYLIY